MSELKAKFILNEQEPIKSKFVINSTPNKLSQLENDLGFITADNIPEIDTSELATKEELENVSNSIPTKTSQLTNDSGFLTEHQDLSSLATKEELNQKQDEITDLETIRTNASKGATAVQPEQLAIVATSGSYNDLTDKPEIGGGGETYTAGNGLNLINNNFELLQQDFGVKGVEVVGTLTKDGLTYSGFSSSNYLTIPAQKTLTGTDSYEIQFKFRTPGLTANSQTICFFATNYALSVSSKYVYLSLPTHTSTSGAFHVVSSPKSNTEYIVNVKRIQDATSYTTIINYSTDNGETWTETTNATTNGTSKNLALSAVKIGQGYGGGVIYLDKSFIKVNGEDWWNPLIDTFRPVARATESLYGLVKPDNNTITINDGVISTSLTDVQVNGTSVLSEGVANIPIASNSRLGVVFPAGFGVMVTASGALAVNKATDALINAKSNNFQPVVPSNLDYAVKVGITTNTNDLTGEEKTNACNWLGAGHQRTTVIDSTTPTIVLDKALSNTDYQYGTITSLSITEIENSYLETNIFFTAGTEITVDLPDTLKIIGNLSFEAEKQYIMSICNNTLIAGVVS